MGATHTCEIGVDIAARSVIWSEESVQVGRKVGTSATLATLLASIASIQVSVLDEAVNIKIRVLQTKYIDTLLG
jgi:hypothetical protein